MVYNKGSRLMSHVAGTRSCGWGCLNGRMIGQVPAASFHPCTGRRRLPSRAVKLLPEHRTGSGMSGLVSLFPGTWAAGVGVVKIRARVSSGRRSRTGFRKGFKILECPRIGAGWWKNALTRSIREWQGL